MQHISYRLAAAILALALLIIPVSAQAAPTHSDTEAWGASVWITLQSWLDSAWDAVEIVLAFPTDDTTTTTIDLTQETDPIVEDDTEMKGHLDPNG